MHFAGILRNRPWGRVSASQLAAAASMLLLTMAAARWLSRPEFGRLAFFLGSSTLFQLLFDFGVSVRVVTAHDLSAKGWRNPGLSAYWSAQVLSYASAAVICLLLASTPYVAEFFHVSRTIVLTSGLAGAGTGLCGFLGSTMQARARWDMFANATFLQVLIRTGATAIGLLLIHSANAGAVGYTVGSWLSLGVLYLIWRKSWKTDFGLSLTVGSRGARLVWSESRWYALSGLIGSLAAYLPLAFVGRVGGAQELAIFGLAWSLSAGAALLLRVTMITLLPAGSDNAIPLHEYRRQVSDTVMPVLALMLLGVLIAPFVVPMLFGRQFTPAIWPLELLLVGSVVLLFANPIQFLHYRLGHARFLALVDTVTLASTLACLLLLPRSIGPPVVAALAIFVAAIASRAVGVAGLLPHRKALADAA